MRHPTWDSIPEKRARAAIRVLEATGDIPVNVFEHARVTKFSALNLMLFSCPEYHSSYGSTIRTPRLEQRGTELAQDVAKARREARGYGFGRGGRKGLKATSLDLPMLPAAWFCLDARRLLSKGFDGKTVLEASIETFSKKLVKKGFPGISLADGDGGACILSYSSKTSFADCEYTLLKRSGGATQMKCEIFGPSEKRPGTRFDFTRDGSPFSQSESAHADAKNKKIRELSKKGYNVVAEGVRLDECILSPSLFSAVKHLSLLSLELFLARVDVPPFVRMHAEHLVSFFESFGERRVPYTGAWNFRMGITENHRGKMDTLVQAAVGIVSRAMDSENGGVLAERTSVAGAGLFEALGKIRRPYGSVFREAPGGVDMKPFGEKVEAFVGRCAACTCEGEEAGLFL